MEKDETKKRGRKKKETTPKQRKIVTKLEESVIGLRTNVRRNEITKDLILHIPLKSTDTEETLFISTKKITSDEPLISNNLKKIVVNTAFPIFNKERWPKRTDIKCWWCTYNFDNVPCCIPHKYENGNFRVYGNFCSFNCAMAYILQFIEDKKWEKISLLNLLHKEIYNTWGDITPAPKKEVLNTYGGKIDIDEFRKTNKRITYDLLIPPIFPIKSHVEIRNTGDSLEKLGQNKLIGSGNLKIRREVPLIKNNSFISRFKD